jgi:hypothetical protein
LTAQIDDVAAVRTVAVTTNVVITMTTNVVMVTTVVVMMTAIVVKMTTNVVTNHALILSTLVVPMR